MKISIVMTYFNRKNQLYRTLLSLKNSKFANNDFEIIIVDDNSSDDEKVNFLDKFDFKFKLIEIKKEDKWYVNPCIPFNIGLRNASGQIIVIQNAECIHYGDILEHAAKIPKNEYWSYSIYSLPQEQNKKLDEIDWEANNIQSILEQIPIENRTAAFNGDEGWYNHPIFRPANFHFISAIHKIKLNLIGHFDERFAAGVGWEDNEFLHRIRKHLKVKTIVEPFGFHQWHYDYAWDNSKIKKNNESIFLGLTK